MAMNTHQQAALMDASMGTDGQILARVFLELGSPTWAGYMHMSNCAGEGAGWQAEERQLFPPPQSERPTQIPGPPPTF